MFRSIQIHFILYAVAMYFWANNLTLFGCTPAITYRNWKSLVPLSVFCRTKKNVCNKNADWIYAEIVFIWMMHFYLNNMANINAL